MTRPLLVMAFVEPALTQLLCYPRYLPSGVMVMLISCALIPAVIGVTYDQVALAAGDSRSFFVFSAIRALVQVTLLVLGVTQYGQIGAIAAMGLAGVLVHPVLVWLAIRHRVWDPLHDLGFGLLGGGWRVLPCGCTGRPLPDFSPGNDLLQMVTQFCDRL